jgi:hypothetical protein
LRGDVKIFLVCYDILAPNLTLLRYFSIYPYRFSVLSQTLSLSKESVVIWLSAIINRLGVWPVKAMTPDYILQVSRSCRAWHGSACRHGPTSPLACVDMHPIMAYLLKHIF